MGRERGRRLLSGRPGRRSIGCWLTAVVVLLGSAACETATGSGSPAAGAGSRSAQSPDGAAGTVLLPTAWDVQASWAKSLSVAMPADLASGADSATAGCAAGPRPAGWLRTEDDQPGDVGFEVPPGQAGPGRVVGYLDRSSAACGDSVGVHLSGPASLVRLQAFRIGAYRGAPARLVWSSQDVPVSPRRHPSLQPGTHLEEPRWPVTVTLAIDPRWVPGFYLLVPYSAGGQAGPAIPLVVRDDAGREPILFAASTMTWNAYGEYGRYSLYHGPGATVAARYAARARVATFRRPLLGAGYLQLVTMDLPVIEEIERLGIDAAYTTDVDLDLRPSQLMRHNALVLGGHSEYWTEREYDALEAARDSGLNLAFLGANNLWWHARLSSSTGTADPEPDRETVYRQLIGDPNPRSEPEGFTMLWSQWPMHREGAPVLGESHAAIAVHGGYQIMSAPGWMLSGTGLHDGSVLPDAVGNEADGYNPLAANPPTLDVVAAGVLLGARGAATVSAGYYSAPSGAAVFTAGTTDWACVLATSCADQSPPAATVAAVQAITRNILTAFALPRAGRRHPSRPSVPPPTEQLQPELAPEAVGRYGGSEVSEDGTPDRPAVGARP